MVDEDIQLLKTFLAEVREHLEMIDHGLISLENDPGNDSILSLIFRSFHTIKGSTGYFGFKNLETIAHTCESLLNTIRDKKIAAKTELISYLLESVDAIRDITDKIEKEGQEGESDYGSLINQVKNLSLINNLESNQLEKREENNKNSSISDQESKDSNKSQVKINEAEQTIRVNLVVLEKLMELVGELVLNRNEIHQLMTSKKIDILQNSVQKLNRITTDLQQQILKTRMQPISTALSPLRRIVRDLSLLCNKKVDLVLEGQETELDRSLIEAIKDPLIHLVRNAIDHGIESIEDRKKLKKPEISRLIIRSLSINGQVVIEVTDDGCGLDLQAIKEKAIRRNLITLDQANQISEKEIVNLLFISGFSTRDIVSSISGRGVGLDVVKTNIQKIGGTIDTESTKGVYTTFRLKIPMTIAIMPALIIKVQNHQLAIPQNSVIELIQTRTNSQEPTIETINEQRTYRLRGKLLPLIYLGEILNKSQKSLDLNYPHNIVVLNSNGNLFGVVVDKIHDTQEIVVKPLSEFLKNISIYSGTTTMGDGSIALILNVDEIAKISGILFSEVYKDIISIQSISETQTLYLIMRSNANNRMAIPLNQIVRLEKIPLNNIEKVGNTFVIQYRSGILPIFYLHEFISTSGAKNSPKPNNFNALLWVIIVHHNSDLIGIIVEGVIDIVEISNLTLVPPIRANVLGTAIVKEYVTEFLDVSAIFSKASHLIDSGI